MIKLNPLYIGYSGSIPGQGDAETLLSVCKTKEKLRVCKIDRHLTPIKQQPFECFRFLHVIRTKSVTKKEMNKCMAEI